MRVLSILHLQKPNQCGCVSFEQLWTVSVDGYRGLGLVSRCQLADFLDLALPNLVEGNHVWRLLTSLSASVSTDMSSSLLF